MPILLKKDEYALTLTYKCNWNCRYCAVKNEHDYKDFVSHEEVLCKLSKIPENSIVTLFGGEPGLVARKEIEEYLSILEKKSCKLWLETNGLFLDVYPDLASRFEEIIWHCCDEIGPDVRIVKRDFKNIRYLIIVHDMNVDYLGDFLKNNNDITFDVVEATYPYAEMDGPKLSSKNKNHIIARFGSQMTRESFTRLLNGKDFDKIAFLT